MKSEEGEMKLEKRVPQEIQNCAVKMVGTAHLRLLSTWNVVSVPEELNLNFI